MGSTSHTQFDLVPIPITLPPDAVTISVALGQDHTLALISTGEVYSWGRNSFSQLGYNVESSASGSGSKEIQSIPRKVSGLKHQVVVGVAACQTASAAWTRSEVWTWGTHSGQLGLLRRYCLFCRPDLCESQDIIRNLAGRSKSYPARSPRSQSQCWKSQSQYEVYVHLRAFAYLIACRIVLWPAY